MAVVILCSIYPEGLPALRAFLKTEAASGVVFRPDGLARDTSGGLLDAVIDLCIPGTSPPSNVRHLAIGSGSRISVSSGSNPACAQPGDPL